MNFASCGNEADLVETALPDISFAQHLATPQILSDVKNNMFAHPGQLFYSTLIPVCLWFLSKNKAADLKQGFRHRRNQTRFIDARKIGNIMTAPYFPKNYFSN